jgi:hypothetical protein
MPQHVVSDVRCVGFVSAPPETDLVRIVGCIRSCTIKMIVRAMVRLIEDAGRTAVPGDP